MSGEAIKVAFVPKLQGSPYFEAIDSGAKKAAADLGNVGWLYQGPTSADAAAQAQIVRSFIQQKVDVLVVAGFHDGIGGRHRRRQPLSQQPVGVHAAAGGLPGGVGVEQLGIARTKPNTDRPWMAAPPD